MFQDSDTPERGDASPALDELGLAEMRHRQSNIVQTIASLVQMRLARTKEPQRREELCWAHDLLTALNFLDRKLGDEPEPRFDEYVVEVVEFWDRMTRDSGIRLNSETARIELPQEQSMILALILHELLTNAVKHGFADGRGGTIRVALSCDDENHSAELTVADDGAGLPTVGTAKSLGLSLVERLAGQIEGDFAITSGAATRAILRFPLKRQRR